MTRPVEHRSEDTPLTPGLRQVVLFGRSDGVLGSGTGDGPLLRCRGNREVQETSICGAVAFQSHREVLLLSPRPFESKDMFMCVAAGFSERQNKSASPYFVDITQEREGCL